MQVPRHGRGSTVMDDRQHCCICKWYAIFEGVCCNGGSEYCAEFRCFDDSCEEWQGEVKRKNEKED